MPTISIAGSAERSDVGRYLPGALGDAASGQVPLLAPGVAVLLLALYAAVAATAGWVAATRLGVA